MGNSKRKQEIYISSQGIEKEESMKPALLEKSSMVNELLQARIEIDENVEIHVEEETSKKDPRNFVSEKHIERKEYIEIKEKERVEEKESLDEESCFFDYISSLFEERENDKCVQEKENALEKNERTKKMRVEDRRNMEKELGPILEDLSISLSLNPSYFIISVMFDPSCYGFVNLDDTSLVELNIVGFALELDRNSLQHVCTIISTRGRRHTVEFEGQAENIGGKLILCYRDLTELYG
ncbi:hypothetical protein M9H77_17083 [Catharanthus roseus]|uniref:Uncharacterized protein n=1 Tax=Catharanthus roseus TaxID=4058 RepID=A0ACC0B3K8_CATRO|nr:hypothetical protein M9H77_17083 [Catharanthus roseus]